MTRQLRCSLPSRPFHSVIWRPTRPGDALALASLLVASLAASPAPAQQAPRPSSLGMAGGVARISGDMGYHALAPLEVRTPLRPLRLRADGMFAQWSGGSDERVSALTANLLVDPLPRARVSPYALAGAGGYLAPGATVRSGWTLGAGLRLPGHAVFVESRLHGYLRDQSLPTPITATSSRWRYLWTPLSLGIQF